MCLSPEEGPSSWTTLLTDQHWASRGSLEQPAMDSGPLKAVVGQHIFVGQDHAMVP